MSDKFTLNFKFAAVLIVFLVVGVINAVTIYTVVIQQKDSGRAINLAGRQRMLTQKMSKEALLLHETDSDDEWRQRGADLEKTVTLFDTTLNGLLNGDASLGLVAVSDLETKAKLLEVKELWNSFSGHMGDLINVGRDPVKGLEALTPIVATNIKLLKTMNAAVGLYEKNNNLNTILVIQGVLLLVTLLVTGFAWFFMRREVIGPLKEVASVLGSSAANIEGVSGSVSSSAESIADQASSQAAAAEESSASLEEITSMTRQNAEHTGEANTEMQDTKQIAEKANAFMEEMNKSMADILAAGEETQKIVKTIDEIAFQTNLLSLNAAVEAARAGESGAGFAVVADEVRNLALRSADSARDTSELIDDIVQKIHGGSSLVKKSTEAFQEVAGGAGKVAVLLNEIAHANDEQNIGVSQITTGIHEMDRLAQENAATSEETASAAAEMHKEARQLNGVVGQLVGIVEGSTVS